MFGFNAVLKSTGSALDGGMPIVIQTASADFAALEGHDTGSTAGVLGECAGDSYPIGVQGIANGLGAMGHNGFASGEPAFSGGYNNAARGVYAHASGTDAVGLYATASGIGSLAIFADGPLGTSQAILHTLGSYSGKAMAVYDASGTLLGYLPLYA